MAQIVLGTVGAVVGFFVGGPTGALIGFNIGASLGASMSDTTVQGNKIGDVADQTANEGDPRPIIWGRVRPIGGQLVACSDPKIVKVKHKQSGGKGGGGSTTTVTESVYRTYAMAVCEGPITGFVRIWRNNELVYDARGNDWGAENNSAFLGTATLYLGAWDQMPDPALEGVFGVGEVPPHRGTAYIVMDNELLDDTGGAVPQWIFEVERDEGIFLTSKPYPVEVEESCDHAVNSVYQAKWLLTNYTIPQDSVAHSGLSIESGELRDTVITYSNYATESVAHSGLSITSGSLDVIVITYSNYATESVAHSGLSITSGSLDVIVITYSNYATESVAHSGLSITSGSLS